MAHNYIIRVTAGTVRDVKEHVVVPVNTADPLHITSDLIDARLSVRIKNYGGLPRGSPADSAYFSVEPHAYNNDQYSIALSFKLKRPPGPAVDDAADSKDGDDDAGLAAAADNADDDVGVSGADLQWGNDFDHPIRDRLPPGFGTAMNIVRWWIDPGLEGDAYADSPYLYGPALSSFNALRAGPPAAAAADGDDDDARVGIWVDEGGDEAGLQARRSLGAPDDPKGRMKWALRAENKDRWLWEYGKEYSVDFFNPYLDFSEFALRLPGFTLPIMKYWDGQGLRYVLRNRKTGDLYLAVTFSLYLKEDVNDDGSLKPGTIEAQQKDSRTRLAPGDDKPVVDEDKALEEARKKLGDVDLDKEDKTGSDDVD